MTKVDEAKDTIKTLEEAFPYIPEKERGYILGYAQAVADQKEKKEEKVTA